jgi:hypothetical protein
MVLCGHVSLSREKIAGDRDNAPPEEMAKCMHADRAKPFSRMRSFWSSETE